MNDLVLLGLTAGVPFTITLILVIIDQIFFW